MKIIEEEYLKNSIKKLNIYAEEHSDFLDFFNNCGEITKKSLQSQSFKGDLKFFDELSFILSVITSIISKPYITSKGEEIVLRSTLAPNLTNDMFQKTLRDSTLWIQKGINMIPEHVHYYQQVDEIKIYENIFIVYLIKKIDLEINKYNEFYLSMIQIYGNDDSLTLFEDYISKGMKKLNLINHKIKLIKSTHFYKVIGKDVNILKSIHPTNILTKNRLYNICYKFYKKITTYVDETEKLVDFRNYYCIQLFKVLKQMGFTVLNNSNIYIDNKFSFDKLEFIKNEFVLKLYPELENNGLVLEVKNNKVRGKFKNFSKNLLLFESNLKFDDLNALGKDYYDSVEVISLWNLAIAYDEIIPIFDNYKTEEEIVSYWISSKLQYSSCSIDIYRKYCPSCKSVEIVEKKGSYLCSSCKSKYVFYSFRKKNQNIWFIRYRNKKLSQ